MSVATLDLPIHAVPAPTHARFDLYSQVHKGVRASLCATLIELGRLDPNDNSEVKRLLDQLESVLSYCSSHLDKEDHYVHPALEACQPGATLHVSEDHETHLKHIAELRDLIELVVATDGSARDIATTHLYRRFAMFVGHNLEHMAFEESQHNALLWARYSDEELLEIYQAIMDSTTPTDLAMAAQWLVPNLNPQERAALLQGTAASMPPAMFESVLQMVKPHLPSREWQRICVLLALPVEAFRDTLVDPHLELIKQFVDATFVNFNAELSAALVTSDFIAHPWVHLGVPPGPAGIAPVVAAFDTAFDQVSVTLEDVLEQDDRIAVRYVYSGRNAGSLFGLPATGKHFRLHGIMIARIADGKIAEFWREEDMLGLQQQLGLASLLA